MSPPNSWDAKSGKANVQYFVNIQKQKKKASEENGFTQTHDEGYDEQKALETIALTEKDYWQDVIRAEQNHLVLQEDVAGIETHGETQGRNRMDAQTY